ncbi:MAG: HlyD family type I secretion periplasmic adaptor subunit [Candidatus Parcubacteria bacterium]|nr:HlyD family type I secretion periplasmic adaptor subunit [Burkholderiales bacterium]
MAAPIRDSSRKLRPVPEMEPVQDGRRIVRAGLALIALFFGVFGVWLVLAPLSGAVIATGFVKVASERKTVQHLEGGIVKEILVRNGDQVKMGQPLILMAEVQISAAVEVLRQQLDGELAKASRLRAEASRQPAITFPPELLARQKDAKVAVSLRSEQAQFDARRRLIESQVNLLNTQGKQVEEEIRGLLSQVRSAEEFISLTNEELKMNQALHEKNFVAYPRILGLKRDLAQKDEKRGEYLSLIAQGKQKSSEISIRIGTLTDSQVREATDLLKESERSIADLREKLRPAEDALQRLSIDAPLAGEVVGLKVFTAGGVIAPREPLMDIVPLDAPLVVEGRVQVQDISQVKIGGRAEVQLTAFKQRTTPMVDAVVTYVSADRLTEAGGGGQLPGPYYVIQAKVDPAELRKLGTDARIGTDIKLAPGMPVTVFIKTRERPAIMYLIEPVTDVLRRAFRES